MRPLTGAHSDRHRYYSGISHEPWRIYEVPFATKHLMVNKRGPDGVSKVPLVKPHTVTFVGHPAAMSRDCRLETPVPSELLTSVGELSMHRSTVLPYSHRAVTQRECDAMFKTRSRGKPLATGKTVSPEFYLLNNHQ